jgi:PAS domain S-box-containing protein
MGERKRVLFLVLIMANASLIVAGVTLYILYGAAFEEERERLLETVQSQARLIEAIARFDATHSKNYIGESAREATLSQIIEAHKNYEHSGKTAEFTLAHRQGDHIIFLLRHRHGGLENPRPVRFDSKLAEPMRRALSGRSGTVIGFDYRGETVLAAHEPVAEMDLGIVAKIDLSEIRGPFMKAGLTAGIFTVLVVLIGSTLFFRISNPLLRHMEEQNVKLVRANDNLKQEIAERKHAEESLRQSEEKFRALVENLPDTIFRYDQKFRHTYVSPNVTDVSGTNSDVYIGKTHRELGYPADMCRLWEDKIRRVFETGKPQEEEFDYNSVDGRIALNWRVIPEFDSQGNVKSVLGISRDITERLRAEEIIKSSLKEKEVLLQEIHHRVKNNMQIVSSLFNLQMGQIGRKKVTEIFRDCRNRIYSMALIHDILYETKDFARIDIDDYIDTLTRHLFQIYAVDACLIKTKIQAQKILLDVSKAVPCGLIINELVSNALKYAFPDGKEGEIGIMFHQKDAKTMLMVKDNGIGLPEAFDIDHTETLGLKLVIMLVKQLKGLINTNNDAGAEFQIVF